MSEVRAENDIIKGFLCPICKADLKSFGRLKTHFQESHPEDQDVLKSLKGLFGKATKKILKLDEGGLESLNTANQFEYEPEVQEIGYVRTHTKYFKAVRYNKLENFATETNKLIIRLDQLLQADSSDRRSHEQSVVEWVDGSVVRLCPQCARSFNLTRRQHHCRLCGSVMCHGCSSFLSTRAAKSLILGTALDSADGPAVSEDDSLRLCAPCADTLEGKRRLQLSRSTQPAICELYGQLRSLQAGAEPDVQRYCKMCDSLLAGETAHSLEDTQVLRGQIAKRAEALDQLSQRVAALPEASAGPRAAALQAAVRRAAAAYIKDRLLAVPPLPTPAQLAAARARLLDLAEAAEPARHFTPERLVIRSGWSPAAEPASRTADPLAQQMDIVAGYVRQARAAGRPDEAATLEANLRELHRERQRELHRERQRAAAAAAAAADDT